MEGQQLTLDLFSQLEEARRIPEEMSVSGLLKHLERTLEGMSRSHQMEVAGEALTQLVEAFAERAELLLWEWEDRYKGPLMEEAWLTGLVERSPTFDLAAYETELIELPKSLTGDKSFRGTHLRYISKKEAISELNRERARTVDEIVLLAHDENIQHLEQAMSEVLLEWGGEASLCEVARTIAGNGSTMMFFLAALLSSQLILFNTGQHFYTGLSCLMVRQS